MLIHVGICLQTALVKNVTHDEIWHLPVGLRNLRDGDPGVERLNPPLTRMWAAIPLWLGGARLDAEVAGMACGKEFVAANPDTFSAWYRRGRLFNILFSLVAGTLLFALGERLFGTRCALLALLLYSTCPNIIAYASIVTPDIGLMCGFVATFWALWRWMDRRTWLRAAALGLILGLTQATKFTAILLYPLLLGILLLQFRWRDSSRPADEGAPFFDRGDGRQICLQLLVIAAVSLATLAAAYRFQGLGRPLGSFAFLSPEMQTVQELFAFAPGLPVPLPENYLLGLDEQRSIMKSPHPVYLDGQWSVSGFRSYYLKTLLYKLPHALQLLFVVALLATALGRCGPRRMRDTLSLLLPAAALLGVASFESMQLGMRYVLPALPLLMIVAGRCAAIWEGASARARRVALAAGLALCGFSLRHHPNHLAYFNELAGGPVGGRHHLLDSNLDWGQDLILVQQYIESRGLRSMGLAYFGTLHPQALGIDFTLPPSWGPQPGIYAVSVNYVMGRPHVVTRPDGTSRSVDFQEWGYFREMTPVTTLGGSIDIYEVPPAGAGSGRD